MYNYFHIEYIYNHIYIYIPIMKYDAYCLLYTQLLFSTIFVGYNHVLWEAGPLRSSRWLHFQWVPGSAEPHPVPMVSHFGVEQHWKTYLKPFSWVETKPSNQGNFISQNWFSAQVVSFRIAETIDIFNSKDQDSMRDD